MTNGRMCQATRLIRVDNQNWEYLRKKMQELKIDDERLISFNEALKELIKIAQQQKKGER